jgi:hypothetical protein
MRHASIALARVPLVLVAVIAALGSGCGASSQGSTTAPGDAGEEGSVSVAAPRPIAPASASFTTGRQPTFRWTLEGGATGARVEVCADRACGRVLTSFDVTGSSGAPPSALPPGVAFWRLLGRQGASVGTEVSPTWEMHVGAATSPVSLTWGALSDGNGDGIADVVAADSDNFSMTQHVYVHLGSPSGPSPTPSSVLSARMPQLHYAASIAVAGDLDGDGYPELAVGSPNEDSVYVYSGGSMGWHEPPAVVLQGPAMTSFGMAVSAAGDVDGDGYADLIVGMPAREPTAAQPVQGAAMVFFGSASGASSSRSVNLPSYGSSGEQNVAQYVASAGDADGDGFADVVVYGGLGTTDPQNLLVYPGSAKGFGTRAPTVLQYEGANTTWLGNANLLSCAGDVDGDGYPDLAMGSASPPNSGYETDHVSIFSGGPSGLSAAPARRLDSTTSASDHFAMSLAGGDLGGSDLDDVAIAIVSYATVPLAAEVYQGNPVDPMLVSTITTSDATSEFEREVSVYDVDGDGYADLIVGYPSRQTTSGDGGVLHGAVGVYKGGAAGVSLTPAYTLLPPDGTSVAYGASLARP